MWPFFFFFFFLVAKATNRTFFFFFSFSLLWTKRVLRTVCVFLTGGGLLAEHTLSLEVHLGVGLADEAIGFNDL